MKDTALLLVYICTKQGQRLGMGSRNRLYRYQTSVSIRLATQRQNHFQFPVTPPLMVAVLRPSPVLWQAHKPFNQPLMPYSHTPSYSCPNHLRAFSFSLSVEETSIAMLGESLALAVVTTATFANTVE